MSCCGDGACFRTLVVTLEYSRPGFRSARVHRARDQELGAYQLDTVTPFLRGRKKSFSATPRTRRCQLRSPHSQDRSQVPRN